LIFRSKSIVYVFRKFTEEILVIEVLLGSILKLCFDYRETKLDSASLNSFQISKILNQIKDKVFLSPTAPAIRSSEQIKPCNSGFVTFEIRGNRNGQLPELILERYLAFIGVQKIQIR